MSNKKIHLLSPHTINQIAAGEVIENPSSVVKELIENALDAGATEVVVEIKEGGRQLIRVSDNGCGMGDEDARSSLERHATSKINAVDDILSVATMGFRGEAVPSIASISKFTLLTCEHDAKEGTLLIVDGGRLISQAPAVRARGTTVEVKALFFNVPVRRKFQRSPAYDGNEILKVVTLIALANPSRKFELIDEGKTLLKTAASSSSDALGLLSDRIYDVLGEDFLSTLCPLEAEADGFKMVGFAALPSMSRPTRSGQYLFVNGRAVAVPAVAYAVRDGYGTALPPQRHPLFVLHLTLPGDLIDVNVHPQKREVRIRQEQRLKAFVSNAVEGALRSHLMEEPHPCPVHEPAPCNQSFAGVPAIDEEPSFIMPGAGVSFQTRPLPMKEERLNTSRQQTTIRAQEPLFEVEVTKREAPQKPKVVATLKGYILVEPPSADESEKLWLVDQRSAHCRVIYDKLSRKEGQPELQTLLIPYTFELPGHEAAALRELLPRFNGMGILMRELGQQTFVVDALPQILGPVDVQALIDDLIKGVNDEDEEGAGFSRAAEKRVALAASRIAVSSRTKMPVIEAEALVESLFSSERPYQCPIGKMTIAKLSQLQLSKLF